MFSATETVRICMRANPPSPTEYWQTALPVRLDGTGECYIRQNYGNFQYFQWDKLPVPKDWGPPLAGGIYLRPKMTAAYFRGSTAYRVATRWIPGRQKPESWTFRLSQSHRTETLEVLTNHLDAIGVEWLWLCNASGNPLSKCAFHSSRK